MIIIMKKYISIGRMNRSMVIFAMYLLCFFNNLHNMRMRGI